MGAGSALGVPVAGRRIRRGQPERIPAGLGSAEVTVQAAVVNRHQTARLAELADYQPLFDNAKKLRVLLAELQDLPLQIIEEDSTRQP